MIQRKMQKQLLNINSMHTDVQIAIVQELAENKKNENFYYLLFTAHCCPTAS